MNFFNNNITQIALVSFMDWFSKISIEKYQTISVSGDDIFAQRKIIKVPCQYATREKFVEILRSSSSRKAMNPELRDKNPVEMQWILPRISCNLTSPTYDASRRLIKTQKVDDVNNSSTNKGSSYSPTPYNLNIEVSSISKTLDDSLQIMEQIIPFFSPAMNINIKLYSNQESESIPIILNSVVMDNPTDIPEMDERLFTVTYSFVMKLNYYSTKKTTPIVNSMTVGLINGNDVVRLDKTFIQNMNIIQDKFSQYKLNALLATPVVVPTITSTYEAGITEADSFLSDTMLALGDPQIILTQGVSSISLDTPSISGNTELLNSIKIFYRLDDVNTIYEYTTPIEINFDKINYWIILGTNIDSRQLEVYEYQVI